MAYSKQAAFPETAKTDLQTASDCMRAGFERKKNILSAGEPLTGRI